MRLIDAETLGLELKVSPNGYLYVTDNDIIEAPTVDAVEVVRCRHCKNRQYCRTSNVWAVPPNDDWFCADGERKENET